MAKQKISITLREDQLEAVRKLVASHTPASLSGFVQHAVAVA